MELEKNVTKKLKPDQQAAIAQLFSRYPELAKLQKLNQEYQQLNNKMEEKLKTLSQCLEQADKNFKNVAQEYNEFVANAKRNETMSFITGIAVGCVTTGLIYWKLKSSE